MSKQLLNVVRIVKAAPTCECRRQRIAFRARSLRPAVREMQALLLGGAFGLSHLWLQRPRFTSGVIQRFREKQIADEYRSNQ
jgi:hypothetical protein